MFQKHLYFVNIVSILFLCVFTNNTVFAELTVELDVQPANTEVEVGSSPIAITANVQGTELNFDWQLTGSGSFQGETNGYAVIYIPPSTIDSSSAVAIVSVKVSDYRKQEATESVVFTIIQKDTGSHSEQSQMPEESPPLNPEGTLIFSENFDNGLKGWDTWMDTIESFNDNQQGKCIKIHRANGKKPVWLSKTFTGLSGTLVVEAMIRAENIVKSEGRDRVGAFLVPITEKGSVQTDYPGIQLVGDFDWTYKQVEVYVEKTDEVRVQFGLQNTSGALYVDDVKIFQKAP